MYRCSTAVLADLERHQVVHDAMAGRWGRLQERLGPRRGASLAALLAGCAEGARGPWQLVLTGHSLGAGVAALLALSFESLFPGRCAGRVPRLRCVLHLHRCACSTCLLHVPRPRCACAAASRSMAAAPAAGKRASGRTRPARRPRTAAGWPPAPPAPPRPRRVRGWCFSPPGALMSPAASRRLVPAVTSVVLGKDMVPRLSLATTQALCDQMMLAAALVRLPKAQVGGRRVLRLLRLLGAICPGSARAADSRPARPRRRRRRRRAGDAGRQPGQGVARGGAVPRLARRGARGGAQRVPALPGAAGAAGCAAGRPRLPLARRAPPAGWPATAAPPPPHPGPCPRPPPPAQTRTPGWRWPRRSCRRGACCTCAA